MLFYAVSILEGVGVAAELRIPYVFLRGFFIKGFLSGHFTY